MQVNCLNGHWPMARICIIMKSLEFGYAANQLLPHKWLGSTSICLDLQQMLFHWFSTLLLAIWIIGTQTQWLITAQCSICSSPPNSLPSSWTWPPYLPLQLDPWLYHGRPRSVSIGNISSVTRNLNWPAKNSNSTSVIEHYGLPWGCFLILLL